MYTKVLLAYDGSEAGQKALLDCREIVQWSHAELRLIAVMPRPVTSVAAEGWVYTQEADVAQRDRHQAVLDQGLQRLRVGPAARQALAERYLEPRASA